MAGGMGRRPDWGTLAQRTGPPADEPPRAPEPEAASPPTPPVKPCWVTDRHGRLPGLLLGWRRRADGFEGRVVRAVQDDDGWIVVEEWLPASLLDRASTH